MSNKFFEVNEISLPLKHKISSIVYRDEVFFYKTCTLQLCLMGDETE